MSVLRGREPRAKIAILGYTEHRQLAPFDDPDWEYWGLNDLHFQLPPTIPVERIRWFQIHEWIENGKEHPFKPPSGPPSPRMADSIHWLRQWQDRVPIYLLKPQKELPHAIVLDQQKMFDYFGSNYFTNSVSWMMGHAIMLLDPDNEGSPKQPARDGAEIGIWGVDMMVAGGPGAEYGWQRPSCEWMVGEARGRGITVTIPPQSDLMKTAFPYGDQQGNDFRKWLQHNRANLSNRRGQVNAEMNRMQLANAELTGAINWCDRILMTHMPGDPGEPSNARACHPNAHALTAMGMETVPPVKEDRIPTPEPITQE